MKRGTAPTLAAASGTLANQVLKALPKNLKSARGKGLNLDEPANRPPTVSDLSHGSGSTGPASDPISFCESATFRLHTIDHINCPACEALDELMKADLLGMANQTFPEAAEVWQSLRRNSNALRDRTHEAVGEYIASLTKFFKGIVMRSINPGMVRAYQLARRSNCIAVTDKVHRPWQRMASNSRINHELNVLAQMLRACNEWEKIRPYYFPLSVPNWSPRQILSETEEEELFRKVAG